MNRSPYSSLKRGRCALSTTLVILLAVAPAAAQSDTAPLATESDLTSEPVHRDKIDDGCLLQKLREAAPETTVQHLRDSCAAQALDPNQSLVLQRMRRERAAATIRSILTPHNRNYFLPASYLGDANEEPYLLDDDLGFGNDENLQSAEIKFQLSLKFNIFNDLLLKDDSVHFAFTALSFWQAYNSDISAPFRETNYEPELFWTAPIDWRPLGLNANVFSLGLSHQSNGRSGLLSRSWNRIYAEFTWEKNRWVFKLKPWWRIPENEKEDPQQADGDDNPDLEKFLGHFEFSTSYRRRNQEFTLLLRNNLRSENRGAVQLDYTFPLWRGIRGFAQYFNGYGESMIDYNANVERVGVGILLSDLL